MTMTKSSSDLAKLEWFNYALSNANDDPKMSTYLKEIGISAEALEEGRNLFSNASKAYSDANEARKKRLEAHETFKEKAGALARQVTLDKKKIRMALVNKPGVQKKLELNRSVEKNRLKQFEMSKSFYEVLSKNTKLLKPLSKLGITEEYVMTRLEAVSEVGKAKTDYMLEKGFSQSATIAKNKAIKTISTWMTQFFSISRAAFKDEPQLMEALGLIIKN
jgi:hypothetical protein